VRQFGLQGEAGLRRGRAAGREEKAREGDMHKAEQDASTDATELPGRFYRHKLNRT
jgi:hypothetical protein